MIFNRKCHWRLCTSCGIRYRKNTGCSSAETALSWIFCSQLAEIPYAGSRMKRYTEGKRGNAEENKLRHGRDNYCLYRSFKDAGVFGMTASIYDFGYDTDTARRVKRGRPVTASPCSLQQTASYKTGLSFLHESCTDPSVSVLLPCPDQGSSVHTSRSGRCEHHESRSR